jgi:hypothetical protein
MKTTALVLATTLGLVACGGGADGDDDPADAGPTTTATAYALGTDYEAAGILSRIDLPALTVSPGVVAGVASIDGVIRAVAGKLYVVNRFGFDNVTIVDPATGQLVDQISTGSGTNPQDVAVKGDKLYVAAFNSPDLIILDAANPGAAPTTIDLSSYDADGVPEAGSVLLVGDTLFVTLALLDGTFTSSGGKVVVIDTTTDEVTGAFDLTYKNPFGRLTATPAGGALGGDVLVTTTEDYGAGPGCVERITTGPSPGAGGCLVENATLGGFAGVTGWGGERVWLAVSTSATEGKLVSVMPDGTVQNASMTPTTQQPTDFAVCPTGHIVVSDATGGGLRVYDESGAELTSQVLDIGLPPAFADGVICF